MDDMSGTIDDAIRVRRVLELIYEPGSRKIEPHAYGRSADGHLLLRAYQIAGASASGEHEHWKLFRVGRIARLTGTDVHFDGPRPGYKRGDKAMKGGIIREL